MTTWRPTSSSVDIAGASCTPGPSPTARALRLEGLRAEGPDALHALLERVGDPPWDVEVTDGDPIAGMLAAEGFEPYARMAVMARTIEGMKRPDHVPDVTVEPYRNEWSSAFANAEAMAMEGLAAFAEMGQPTGYEEAEGFDAFVVARDQRDMLGFAQAMVPEGWINWMGVVPDARRRGIGRLLVAELAPPGARGARDPPRGAGGGRHARAGVPGGPRVPRARVAPHPHDPPGLMSRPAALRFEGDRARALEAIYLTPDVVAQREAVLAALDPLPGERVLDLGCGPGLLAAAIAKRVGARGAVHGVDVSADMLALAAAREQPEGAAAVELSQQDVTALDMPDGSFDAAVCTQVYEYVDDMPAALAEVRRVLRPGRRPGRARHGLGLDRVALVGRRAHGAGPDRLGRAPRAPRPPPRGCPSCCARPGSRSSEVQVVPLLNVGDDPETYSAGMRGLIAEFVTGHGVGEDEAAAWMEDLETLGDRSFFSLNRYLFTAVGP